MKEYIEQYIYIRHNMIEILSDMADIYFTNKWNAINKFIIINQVKKIVKDELKIKFPDFPGKYLPNVKIKIFDEEKQVEIGVQEYFNSDITLSFLANVEYEDNVYDLYCRKSFDPNVQNIFYARYGHSDNMFDKGSKSAEAQYMMGMTTPLAIAYGFALDEGYIEED